MLNLDTPRIREINLFEAAIRKLTSKGDILRFLSHFYTSDIYDAYHFKLGSKSTLIIRNPVWIETVLKQSDLFHKNLKEVSEIIGRGIISVNDEEWRRQRVNLAPFFTRNSTQEALGSMSEEIELFMRGLSQNSQPQNSQSQNGQARLDFFFVESEMNRLTLKMISRALFTSSADRLIPAFEKHLGGLFNHVSERLQTLTLLPLNNPFPRSRAFFKKRDLVWNSLDQVIQDRVTQNRGRKDQRKPDLLDVLISSESGEESFEKALQKIRDQMMTILVAGHETTAHLLTWTLFYLASQPSQQEWLYLKLHQSNMRTIEDYQRDETLLSFFSESLRMYPPVWYLERIASSDTSLGGYPIPKGTSIGLCAFHSHRDPLYWEHSDAFDSDRFLAANHGRQKKGAYFPFGGGQRVCIGQGIAKAQFFMILSALMKEFRFLPQHANKLESSRRTIPLMRPSLTLRPEKNQTIRLLRRSR